MKVRTTGTGENLMKHYHTTWPKAAIAWTRNAFHLLKFAQQRNSWVYYKDALPTQCMC